jgi:hypothetical protein
MTAETHNAKQISESVPNLFETIPVLVVRALPDGFAEFETTPATNMRAAHRRFSRVARYPYERKAP